MKRLLFLFAMLLTPFVLMAQEVIPSEGAITIDLTTFTGIMAFVTMSATQLAKVVPYIDTHKWAKVLSAVVIGMLVCILAWLLKVSPLLIGSEWWEALLYGVAVGSCNCGSHPQTACLHPTAQRLRHYLSASDHLIYQDAPAMLSLIFPSA